MQTVATIALAGFALCKRQYFRSHSGMCLCIVTAKSDL